MTGVIIRKIHAGKTTYQISYDTVKELSSTRQESEKEEEIIPLDVLQAALKCNNVRRSRGSYSGTVCYKS